MSTADGASAPEPLLPPRVALTPSRASAPTAWLPRLVLAPSFIVSFLFIYGLIAWNGPESNWIG